MEMGYGEKRGRERKGEKGRAERAREGTRKIKKDTENREGVE